MSETEKEIRTHEGEPKEKLDARDSRKIYEAPEVTALDLLAVVKAGGTKILDGNSTRHT